MPRHIPPRPTNSDEALAALRAAFGNPEPPPLIHQVPFDHDQGPLERIAAGAAQETDWIDYALDLYYVELQGDLFRWAFPLCLEQWRTAHRNAAESTFLDHFWRALCEPRFASRQLLFDEWLPPAARIATEEFFAAVWLELAEQDISLLHFGQAKHFYTTLGALASFGCFLRQFPELIERWLRLDSHGHAALLLAYVSSLVYGEQDNPMFEPWHPNTGGGPPALWEMGSDDGVWLDSNLEALPRLLNAESLADAAARARDILHDHPDARIAEIIATDAAAAPDRVNRRIALLRQTYATRRRPIWTHWPD